MNWDEIGILISRFSCFNLRRLSGGRWECQSRFCGNPFDHVTKRDDKRVCRCAFGKSDTPEEAIVLAGKKIGIE